MHTHLLSKLPYRYFAYPAIVAACLLFAIGCAPQKVGTARVRKTLPDKTVIEARVDNPPKAEAPATVKMSEAGEVTVSVSPPRKEDTAMKHLWFVPWAGAALMVLGVMSLMLRSYLPIVPVTASAGMVLCGIALLVMPKVIQEAWWLAIPIGLIAALYFWGVYDNRNLILSPPPTETES